jgi:hypothetical protein
MSFMFYHAMSAWALKWHVRPSYNRKSSSILTNEGPNSNWNSFKSMFCIQDQFLKKQNTSHHSFSASIVCYFEFPLTLHSSCRGSCALLWCIQGSRKQVGGLTLWSAMWNVWGKIMQMVTNAAGLKWDNKIRNGGHKGARHLEENRLDLPPS